MRVLVTGGAGYIGSFMTRRLIDYNHTVVVADSLEKGHQEAVDSRAKFVKGNLLNKSFVQELFSSNQFDAVLHFAAYISMGESMEKPGMYFENNVYSALNVLDQMAQHDIKKFIFSSSAGVYGSPERVPIPEDHPKNPGNPYGESKLLVERILEWYHTIFGIGFVALRYFNASGAALDGSQGEQHFPETHIIPNIMKAAINNEKFTLFGSDYKTPDGTCVRDYIHVLDLVEAHILALKKLDRENGGYQYNVGTGKGYSNKEVVDMVKNISSSDIQISHEARRPGDADELVADASKIKEDLGFVPKYSDLETIVTSAWEWHRKMKK